MRSSDFSLRDLYAALDAQRQARGLPWAQATREISRCAGWTGARSISTSTVTGTRFRRAAEGDGVLQMLLWLNRSPESFVPGHPEFGESNTGMPNVPANKILRFDTRRLHAALDAQRMERDMTWTQVAAGLGLGVSTLTYLAKGKRVGFPNVMRMVTWLGRPASDFTRASDR